MSKISASIVTYNSSDVIANLLDDLKDCQIDDVVVVDNNSSDDTTHIVSEEYPWVKLITSKKNLGYGGGHNIAIRKVESDIHFIINPDIKVNNEQIHSMVSFMETNPDVVLMCPKVLNNDGTEQFLPKRNPRLKYLIGGFFGINHLRDEYTMKKSVFLKPTEIDFCTGCFMTCKTSCLKECGGFDERFFLYFEDADLSRRMKKLGKVVYNPHSTVVHGWKRENGRTLRGVLRFLCSFYKYKRKWKNEKTRS